MLLPKKVGGKLVLGEPIMIAQNCLGSCQHSGGPASTATRDGKTHIVWGEIAPDDAPGVRVAGVLVDAEGVEPACDMRLRFRAVDAGDHRIPGFAPVR